MDGKIATVAGLAALIAAPAVAGATPQAAQEPAVPVAASYAELLNPIPNAPERLRIADAQAYAAQPQLIEAQYVAHHHHHHRYNYKKLEWARHHGYVWSGGPGGRWIHTSRHHHHHHHHHY
jgi:hypothetical protein